MDGGRMERDSLFTLYHLHFKAIFTMYLIKTFDTEKVIEK